MKATVTVAKNSSCRATVKVKIADKELEDLPRNKVEEMFRKKAIEASKKEHFEEFDAVYHIEDIKIHK